MANLSLREAVKEFNVSRPTLTKSLNSGKLSGVRNGKGQWEIDTSELARVYQRRVVNSEIGGKTEQGKFAGHDVPLSGEIEKLRTALALAEARAEAAEKLAQERSERIEDLRRILPPPNLSASGKPRGLWSWIIRRST